MNAKSASYAIIARSVKDTSAKQFFSKKLIDFPSRRGSQKRLSLLLLPMVNDLELIVKEYPKELDTLRVYAIGDVHVGSEQFDEKAIRKKIKIIEEDRAAAVVLVGDLGDYGLKTSVSNVYKQVLSPAEQQDYIYELFLPIVDKITACVSGNHEARLVRETGIDPLLTLCCRWRIENVYRENVAITKYKFGTLAGKKGQQICFIGVASHGSTRNKHRKFTVGFDNVDFYISGHSHQAEYSPRGRIRVDRINETAAWVPMKEIVVDAHLKPGGYSLKNEHEIAPPPELQYLELSTYRKGRGNTRKTYKTMDYHAIQI